MRTAQGMAWHGEEYSPDMIEIQQVLSHADVMVVVDLAREIWIDHYTPIIGAKQVEYMLDRFQSADSIRSQLSEGYEYYLAVADTRQCGYLAVAADVDDSSLMISKIYVRRESRGCGIGRKLLDFAEIICRQRELRSIWLTVNKFNCNSIAWYERVGFVNAGELVQDIGNAFRMDDYKMIKVFQL